MLKVRDILEGQLDLPVGTKTIPVLSLVEGLLGVASEYQGCSDPGQLPSVSVSDPHTDGTMIVQSNTNLAGKVATWVTEDCRDQTTQDEQDDGTGVLPSDRVRLLQIRQLVDQMLAFGQK